ncbi:hypothetical protein EON65_36910 [archaeon]|nr:MAG: hypothetical protein EON65_36910 [archaeon]
MDFNHPKTLRAIGFTLNQLWESQCYSWSQLLSAGYPLSYFKQLRNAVNTAQNTATMGTQSTVSLDGHEATPWQCHLTVLELRKAGYSIAQCKAAGFDVPSLLAGGFTELEVVNSQMFSIRELQRAGCDIQRLALKELFEQTNGKHWRNRTNWCSVSPIATWFGAHVDGRGIVVKIDLRGNALTGQLPVSLCLLTGLEYLDLSGNMLSGLLSESVWANFSNLKDLWLDRNEFTPQEARLNKAMLSKVLPKCRVRI